MTPESAFLVSLGQALATMSLYDHGHPARSRAFDASYEQLLKLVAASSCVEYSFLGGEAVAGTRVMSEMGTWDWASKLSAARIERIEIDADVTKEAYDGFLDELFRQLVGRCVDTAESRQLVRPAIRFGLLKIKDPGSGRGAGRGDEAGGGGVGLGGEDFRGGPDEIAISLNEEIAAVQWIHDEVARTHEIPMTEAEAVVHSLAAAMHRDEQMLVPLLTLRQYDQYTTTHACNVSVLAMGLSGRMGLSPGEVRAIGVAGLLHDIGKVAIPHDLLVKPGRYTDEERKVIQGHPVAGARMILERERGLGLAAVVAYEHHIFLNGEGYPAMRFPRACHLASRIVHVCDIYDALCTDRPYRQAWEPEQALTYLQEQAGRELDPEVVRAFSEMVADAPVQRLPMAEAPPAEADPAASAAELPSANHLCNPPERASVQPSPG